MFCPSDRLQFGKGGGVSGRLINRRKGKELSWRKMEFFLGFFLFQTRAKRTRKKKKEKKKKPFPLTPALFPHIPPTVLLSFSFLAITALTMAKDDTTSNPPEGCPMHNKNDSHTTKERPTTSMPEADGPYCPMPSKEREAQQQPTQKTPTIPPGCPMHNNEEAINLLNMMPSHLSQSAHNEQTIRLPTERVISSIPKAKGDDTAAKWEYPSPQQFYNALKRKGWETPEEEIETMVDIHNFLNEEAWQEVLKWESKFKCDCAEDPYLAKFQGRPKEVSPKARWHSFWGVPRPFDRHDWYIKRCDQERRYVIDYYEAPEEVPGVPVFHLDVRPALDDMPSVMLRFKEAAKMKWNQWFPSPANDSSKG
ncbi:cytochrome c/c1 heme lyase-domain-containing protein [Mycotypha africana]|uniref:cytochrome c/c1 heme lyase-domain-containing protein n=1 Tax=Mycotypha africana TaxID=64632 RepID=UPI00230180FF|nr:cytochrome c/c1 heme lyase-domain-containing protein [Mycotypha africana]KAI8975057.1 cytochrome c/c1 heme lyase-domain-containing protein [Mycotypha africana]